VVENPIRGDERRGGDLASGEGIGLFGVEEDGAALGCTEAVEGAAPIEIGSDELGFGERSGRKSLSDHATYPPFDLGGFHRADPMRVPGESLHETSVTR